MIKLHGKKKGVSLLIALGLIGVITFSSLILTNVTVTSIRQSANANRSAEAYYAAEGGLEMGLLENSKHGSGYSATLTPKNYGGGVSTAAVTIQGQVPMDVRYTSPSSYANMYGAPTPGTGNVGAGCDPLKALRSDGFWYSPTKTPHYVAGTNQPDSTYTINVLEAADHPCNWNRIKVGESVSIPLYYTTTDVNLGCPVDPSNSGSYVCNLVTSQSLDSFVLRVRTPCINKDEMCLFSGRYDFDTSYIDPVYGSNEPIMSWQITGVDQATQASLVLGPKIVIISEFLKPASSIISEYKLLSSKSTGFTVLEISNSGNNGTDLNKCSDNILNFLLNQSSTCDWNLPLSIQKPTLKLSIIQSMKSASPPETIPYLEYQLLSSLALSTPPADTSQTITSEGLSGEFKWTLEVKKPQGGGLLEYVIQQ